jgi:hypothetical protein
MHAVPGIADALTGGSFGPESSISALVVSLIGSVAVLGLAWTRGCFTAVDERLPATAEKGTQRDASGKQV